MCYYSLTWTWDTWKTVNCTGSWHFSLDGLLPPETTWPRPVFLSFHPNPSPDVNVCCQTDICCHSCCWLRCSIARSAVAVCCLSMGKDGQNLLIQGSEECDFNKQHSGIDPDNQKLCIVVDHFCATAGGNRGGSGEAIAVELVAAMTAGKRLMGGWSNWGREGWERMGQHGCASIKSMSTWFEPWKTKKDLNQAHMDFRQARASSPFFNIRLLRLSPPSHLIPTSRYTFSKMPSVS